MPEEWKPVVIIGVAAFSMYLLYEFGKGQGWWTFRRRLTVMRR